MNIIDAVIILVLLAGAVVGLKRGFTKQLLSFLGIFLVVVIAFLLKNPLSTFMYENLPFFKFGGLFKGVTVLNIALYEVLAFIILVSVLTIIMRLLIFASSIFEKILNFTIILGIPSKILGAVLGLIESFVWVFIVLYVVSLPVFNISFVNESKYKDKILKSTPILSGYVDKSIKVINEFTALKDKYENTPNANEFNKETLDLFLKYKVVTVDSVDLLIKKNKIGINGIDGVLNCYREKPIGACTH